MKRTRNENSYPPPSQNPVFNRSPQNKERKKTQAIHLSPPPPFQNPHFMIVEIGSTDGEWRWVGEEEEMGGVRENKGSESIKKQD